MDLPFRSAANASALSGKPFQPGDRIWSLLVRNDSGDIERVDLLAAELADFPHPGQILCRWCQLIRTPELSAASQQRHLLLSAEDLFLQLCDNPESQTTEPVSTQTANAATADPAHAAADAAREQLKFFLALQLERKRILRSAGKGRYLHVKTKQIFPVANLPLSADLVQTMAPLLDLLRPAK